MPIVLPSPIAAAAAQSISSSATDVSQGITLDAALAAADSANIDVLTARLAVETANANLRSADTAPNPIFSTNVVQFRPSQVGRLPYNQLVDSVVRIDVPLERGGKRQARTGAARASIDAAQGDLGNARRQMRIAVTGAYFDLKAAEARAVILRSVADSYAQAETIAARQQRAGAMSNGDLARQRVESLRAQADAAAGLSNRREAQLTLATLIGRETDAASLATTSDWPVGGVSSGEAPQSLASRRPDILAAQARVVAARRNLDGAHALRHPDITVGAQYERAGGDLGVGNSGGVGVSIPLPFRNRYNGEVDAAGVAVRQAEAQAAKAAAGATAEIAVARRALAEAIDRRRLIDEEEIPAARKAASVAEFAYAHGAMALLDLLDARRSLRAVELGAIDGHADEAKAIARLRAAETTGVD